MPERTRRDAAQREEREPAALPPRTPAMTVVHAGPAVQREGGSVGRNRVRARWRIPAPSTASSPWWCTPPTASTTAAWPRTRSGDGDRDAARIALHQLTRGGDFVLRSTPLEIGYPGTPLFDADDNLVAHGLSTNRASEVLGTTQQRRANAVLKGGLKIFTSYDPYVQLAASRAVAPKRSEPYCWTRPARRWTACSPRCFKRSAPRAR